jgi:hypothetical protein
VEDLIACHDARFGFTGYHYYITRDLPGVQKACPCFDAKTEYKDL